MKEAILHIGHGKTGTSFIQSILSLNIKKLDEAGIYYPYDTNFSSAKLGKISSGNGSLLDDHSFTFSSSKKTLISGENLFFKLWPDKVLIEAVLSKVDNLRVLLYSRNIMEMLASTWGQFVKRSGETRSFEHFVLENNDHHHSTVLTWIDLSKRYNFELIIRNYSHHKFEIFNDFINLVIERTEKKDETFSDFLQPPIQTVNRSMTDFEYALLRIFNSVDTKLSHKIADALVELAPNVQSDLPQLSTETFITLKEKYKPVLDQINTYLPKSEHLSFGEKSQFVEKEESKTLLGNVQKQIITEALAQKFLHHQQNNHLNEHNTPNVEFCAQTYLSLNPDVKAAGVNPYQHYLEFGIKEGRRIK